MKKQTDNTQTDNTQHEHKFNILTITNKLISSNKELIEVYLECSCDDDVPQYIIAFFDNDLLSAVQNYHGWLSSIAPALVQQDFRINDKRTELKKGEINND